MLETPEDTQHRYDQMAAIQAQKKDNRRKPFRRSKLEPFRRQILDFAGKGIGPTDIAKWLGKHKQIKAHPATVLRFIQKWSAPDHA